MRHAAGDHEGSGRPGSGDGSRVGAGASLHPFSSSPTAPGTGLGIIRAILD